MLKIDIHTHILPKTWPDLQKKYGYGGFVRLEHEQSGCARMMVDDRCFRRIEANCWDPEVRLKACDEHNVQLQVLSTVPVMFSYWAKPQDTYDLSCFLNDHIANLVAQYPKRFIGLGTVPMQDPDLAIKELERCMQSLGLAGVQIGSHVNGWNFDAPELFPFFQACEKLGAAVFVHPWDMLGEVRLQKYWLSWLVGMPTEISIAICSLIFGGVFDRLPRLRIAFAHGGGAFPGLLGRIAHGFKVRPDLCAVHGNRSPEDYLKNIYVDALVHDPLQMQLLLAKLGADRIALGSDYPFPLGESRPGELIASLALSDEEKAWLYHKTALQWLNWDLG